MCPSDNTARPFALPAFPPADGLLESLESGEIAATEFELEAGNPGQLAASGQAAEGGSSSASAETSWLQLAALLGAAAEASGALAAVDAVQYVSSLALQQCQQARQQRSAELAAFQWVNEHLLPPEAAAAAAGLLAGAPLSCAAAAAAGAALPPVHPAVAAWALASSRQQLLRQLQAGTGTLQSLEVPLQHWQQQLAAVQQQLGSEVAAAAPFASAELAGLLQRQQQWLQGAAAHAANLLELSQAVLQLEASRTADTPVVAATGEQQAAAAAGQTVDRYQAEQQEGWRRYTALLQQMQQLHGSYAAAQRSVGAATAELQQLQLRRQEAQSIMQSAEDAGSQAAAGFAASALPLVKSTQQLPTVVSSLLPQLAGAGEWAQRLLVVQRWAAELAAAGGSAAPAAEQQAEQAAAAATCVHQLLKALQAVQAALLPARNRLLAGGRGEAAAQQQAADVIDSLSAAIAQLQPQVSSSLPHAPSLMRLRLQHVQLHATVANAGTLR